MNLPSFDFTNWREHPSDNRYEVFFFKTKNESDYFTNLLNTHKIWFEYSEELEEDPYKYYFGIKRTDLNQVKELNHLTLGKFRQPFLGNSVIKYTMVIFMLVVMTIAIISYFKTHA